MTCHESYATESDRRERVSDRRRGRRALRTPTLSSLAVPALAAALWACSSPPPSTAKATAGCTTDSDCKGDRVCQQEECVEPSPAPAGSDAGPAPTQPVCSNSDPSILPIDSTGYVAAACNEYGIQGSFYCYQDSFGSSSCPANGFPYDSASGGMCIHGTTSTNASAYGAGIGLQLNATNGVESAYDATAHQVVGFQLTVTGSTGGDPLEILFAGAASSTLPSPFVIEPGPGSGTVLIADAVVPPVWSVANAGQEANPSQIYALNVQVPASTTTSFVYDFCITAIKPVLGAEGACAATGSSCSTDSDCCDFRAGQGFCGTFAGVAECHDSCNVNSDCRGGCCAPLNHGDVYTSGVCAASTFCP
jgi:hypothetical protein